MISEGNSDEEQIVISKQELRQLHNENLVLTLTIRNGWDQRHQPLKASLEYLCKLNMVTLFKYFASHNMAPSKRSGLGSIKHEYLLLRLPRGELSG